MRLWATPVGVGSGKGLLRAGPASGQLATHNWAEIETTVQDPAPLIEKLPQLLAMERKPKTRSTAVSRRNL